MSDRPRIILLHAYPLHSGLFDQVPMPPGWQVATPDRRGFGAAPLAAAGEAAPEPDLDVLVGDVIADMDRNGTPRAIIGGVSMGGYVALAMVGSHPERVAGLVLADTRSTLDGPAERQGRLQVAGRADGGVIPTGAELVAPLLAEGARPEVRLRMADLAGQAAPESIAWAQRAMAGRRDTTSALAAAAVPVLVIVGEKDTLTPPAESRKMAAAAPNSDLVVIPDAGHLTPAEDPAAFGAALAQWLQHRF